jgi:hypothetical protein
MYDLTFVVCVSYGVVPVCVYRVEDPLGLVLRGFFFWATARFLRSRSPGSPLYSSLRCGVPLRSLSRWECLGVISFVSWTRVGAML